MELSYATDEQRNIHHGRRQQPMMNSSRSADVTFF
jgi:methyl-accepting chemotaxis protein